MRLKLFGGFALDDRAGQEVPVSLRRAQALLGYLALHPARSESREVLVDLLWPDRFRKQAQASLRQVLFELRKQSPVGTPIIDATRSDVAMGPAIEACDVWTFESLARSGELLDAEEMLRLYTGPFLDGPARGPEPFQQWGAIQRARLEGQLESAVLAATAGLDSSDADERVVRMLERLVRSSPMCCQAVLRLMEIATRDGRTVDAIRHYERYAGRLKLEFGEDPPAELADAYATLKSAPGQTPRFSNPGRRPAFARRNPWLKTEVDAPVVAVLPFRCEGSHENAAGLAAALGEDITLMLSGCRWFSVLSRSATHSLEHGAPFIPSDFARRTGADYLVYGSVAERAGSWSVTVELADAETGFIGWAKRYEAPYGDILSWGREICPLIVSALDPAVAESELKAFRKPVLASTGSEAAYQALIAGYRHFYAGEWADALACFHRATREDGTYAHAYAMLALTTYYSAQLARDERWESTLSTAERHARRSLEIDPSEPKASNTLGQVLDWQGRHDEATTHLERAVHLNPSFASASTARGYHAVMVGAFEEARDHMQTAMRLRVGDAGLGLCLPAKVLADLHLGHEKEALQTAHWAARLRPGFWLTRQVLATCLWMSGEIEAAKRCVAALQADYDGLSGTEFADWFPYSNPEFNDPIRQALHDAGWR